MSALIDSFDHLKEIKGVDHLVAVNIGIAIKAATDKTGIAVWIIPGTNLPQHTFVLDFTPIHQDFQNVIGQRCVSVPIGVGTPS
jgi:hypothetical protein